MNAKHKLKQLNEASELLDNLSFRIAWALDFSEFASIDEALTPIGDAIDSAKDEIDEAIEELEAAVAEEKRDKARAVAEVEENSRVRHLLD